MAVSYYSSYVDIHAAAFTGDRHSGVVGHDPLKTEGPF